MSVLETGNRIQALPESVWTQIAAGEVIERPASAVKELIENSLDAGARNIKVRLRDGGRLSIVVEDDGCGIALEDLPLALTPHATSKIQDIRDLETIKTLGYRGEALASLTAIAEIEIRSRPSQKEKDQQEQSREIGGMIRAREGKITDCLTAPCAPGTRVQADNLFGQVPARRKFLKTARGELSRVVACLREYAVARPDVRFVLENDNRECLASDGFGDRVHTLAHFWNADPKDIQYTVVKVGSLTLDCWWQSRPGKNDIMAFVNGRAVNDPTIKSAVSVGARELTGNWAMFLTLDPALVDVNIHPAKAEVRFRHPDEVFRALRIAASKLGSPATAHSFSGDNTPSIAISRSSSSMPSTSEPSLPFETVRVFNTHELTESLDTPPASPARAIQATNPLPVSTPAPESKRTYSVMASGVERGVWNLGSSSTTSIAPRSRSARSSRTSPRTSPPVLLPSKSNKTESERKPERMSIVPDAVYMGQTSSGYLIFDDCNALVLIDPHAAHERVNYEKIKRAAASHDSQGLLVPLLLPPTLAFEALEYRKELETTGFILDECDGGVSLKSIPALPDSAPEPESLLRSSVAALKSGGDGDVREILWRTWATMACKAAVKLTTKLTPEEARSLRRDLLACEQPFFCPHGRPTILKLNMKDIARHFEREARASNRNNEIGFTIDSLRMTSEVES